MEERVYCPICGDFEPIEVRLEKETYPVKNEPIEIMAKVSYCKHCGAELWNETLDNENLKTAFNEYRKRRGLLTSEQIKRIREKYQLSQALFSKVLGLGEKTITRYENGSIQDAAHNGLVLLADKPDALLLLLNANKAALSPTEYEKVSAAIEKLRVKVIESARIGTTNYRANADYKMTVPNAYFGGFNYAAS